MKKILKNSSLLLLLICILTLSSPAAYADNSNPPRTGEITGKTVVAGALSLLVWPGIGQAVNNNKGNKVLTHAVLGILPPYRFWSAYDAMIDRKGGYWDGKI